MNETIELIEAIASMDTTAEIAKAFDAVVNECGNIDGSKEIIAAVIVAASRSGKIKFAMQTKGN